jgi:calcineurin-like phosphoesterase
LASYGEKIFEKGNWKLLVIHLQGEIFMNHKVNNPFSVVEKILEKYKNDKLD